MPDIDEILELLQRQADQLSAVMSSVVGSSKERVDYLLEEEELSSLPSRVTETLALYWHATVDAVTAGGTLPGLSLPSLEALTGRHRVLPPPPPPPSPAAPPSFWQRPLDHLRSRPVLYSVLGAISLTFSSTIIAIHLFPRFRGRLFAQAPFLRPLYIKQGRALPSLPRPRLSPDGKHRLEAVLVLGCDYGTYGREVAKAFERKGFVVLASVSHVGEIDELERSGRGFVKALTLDAGNPLSASSFIRSLNTALSLRYPLNSPGDPFHHISSSSPALQLSSVLNCLPICSYPSSPLPIEALPADAITHLLNCIVQTPLALFKGILPILRGAHSPTGHAYASIITCLPACDRYLGTPFSGSSGALRGIISNSLAQTNDVLRRELSALGTPSASTKRQIRIVNLDVGFLQPVSAHRTHRGATHGADASSSRPTARDVESSLPGHLKAIYAPALTAAIDINANAIARKRLPDVHDLADKLMSIVLANKASKIPERTSVGVGGGPALLALGFLQLIMRIPVTSYYVASLLPTSFVNYFFAFRQRLLMSSLLRHGAHGHSSDSPIGRGARALPRRPLPLPGDASSTSSAPASAASGSSPSSEGDVESDTGEGLLLHESDTILPTYAPSAPPSTQASVPASGVGSPAQPPNEGHFENASQSHQGEEDESTASEEGAKSTVLGESYVRV
ncbi:MAG: hypothetical protein CYPHOPRED_003234 [Cyphobasidiales sp. Tagirdzhanova-0007]|nr:MAG: hypothetical protein CYPHOPRED_003234 [Cyphobasidiales sp. Tagirdzhanova-0007]